MCLAGMLGVKRIVPVNYIWLSSIIGAILHNTGQIIVAVIIMRSFAVIYHYPYLIISGCIAGAFTGICAQLLITCFGVCRIINTGVGGALDQRLNIGDVVISTDVVQHDFDVSPIGFARGEVPYTGLTAFPADDVMRKDAAAAARDAAAGSLVLEGRVCSGDQFIASRNQKQAILNTFGGLCCEMEGGAVAQVCWLNHVPFVIIRAISDRADHAEEINYTAFAGLTARRSAATVRAMIEHEA